MPWANGIYSLPAGTSVSPNETIESSWANSLTQDIESAFNTHTPIAAGGTGASTVESARSNLGLGTGDTPTFAGATLTDTDAGSDAAPILTLFRDSASPAASDSIGQINWDGKDSAGNTTSYISISGVIEDPNSGSEDSRLDLHGYTAGVSVKMMSLLPAGIALGRSGVTSVISHNETDSSVIISGSNGSATGGNIRLNGSSASDANDIIFRSGTTAKMQWDDSDGRWVFPAGVPLRASDTIEHGLWSPSGASIGAVVSSDANTGVVSTSATATGSVKNHTFYNPFGLVGSISTAGTSTSYNTTSDERLKTVKGKLDASETIDATKVYEFNWKADGSVGYGVLAQEAYGVFPAAVRVGGADPTQDPWSVDYSKYVPLLLAEVKSLRARVASLESKE